MKPPLLTRFYAYLINLFFLILPMLVIQFFEGGRGPMKDMPQVMGYSLLAYYGLLGIVQVYLLTFKYTDIGKSYFSLVIVPQNPSFFAGFIPNVLVRIILNGMMSIIIPFYGLIDLLFIFKEEQRCLHDKMAGTSVLVRGNE
jgi:hypothetical protein